MTNPQWLHAEEIPDVEVLDDDKCWTLLEAEAIGRLAVRTEDGVDIFPVNFQVTDRTIFLRSAPGSKLRDITHSSQVAFEIDAHHRKSYWSVVLHGTAERMAFDADIQASAVLELDTFTSSAKWNYIRITPADISGRRFSARGR